ncbi:MAG: hypothetical protein B1H04_04805 [Planctomycetales bacterium 4484_123]|nr:MAG: hypothetical protein B1H04_04805 [Planctomycetales bacterium 4484_123]
MAYGYVVSDLHLFAPWSVATAYMGLLRRAAGRADFFVLNGDIFDFRWTVLRTASATAAAAASWLGELAAAFPRCRFYYIMGNHDGVELLAKELTALASERQNLEWRASYLRLGSALFLHGDLPLRRWRRRRTEPFDRSLSDGFRRKPQALLRCYDWLFHLHVHRCAPLVHRRRRCAKKIARSLRAGPAELAEQVTDIYFGHSHVAFSGYRYAGLTFHNTGSAVRGSRWQLLPVRVRDWDGGS